MTVAASELQLVWEKREKVVIPHWVKVVAWALLGTVVATGVWLATAPTIHFP